MKIDIPTCDFSYCRAYMDGNCHAIESRRETCGFKALQDKETPKKVNVHGLNQCYCPRCGNGNQTGEYCQHCGQHLKD